MLATFLLSGLFLLLVLITFAGEAIVWSFRPYRRFKKMTHLLENAQVKRIHGSKINGHATVRNMGHRRLTELFEVELDTDVQLKTCFAAIFIKEDSIDHSIDHLRLSCCVAWLAMLLGALLVFVASPEKQLELAHVGIWEKIPHLFEFIFSAHLVLFTELALAGFLVLSLVTDVVLLKKIEKAMQ